MLFIIQYEGTIAFAIWRVNADLGVPAIAFLRVDARPDPEARALIFGMDHASGLANRTCGRHVLPDHGRAEPDRREEVTCNGF
ncbi:MAG TPA: hypothetical protein VK090_03335 [Paracoccaceae bacterium]|nr:hypothetical protein [Paracoccaceae bacterium]